VCKPREVKPKEKAKKRRKFEDEIEEDTTLTKETRHSRARRIVDSDEDEDEEEDIDQDEDSEQEMLGIVESLPVKNFIKVVCVVYNAVCRVAFFQIEIHAALRSLRQRWEARDVRNLSESLSYRLPRAPADENTAWSLVLRNLQIPEKQPKAR
jgi:hypothetical protein